MSLAIGLVQDLRAYAHCTAHLVQGADDSYQSSPLTPLYRARLAYHADVATLRDSSRARSIDRIFLV